MALIPSLENSILGLMILNQDVLTTDLYQDTEGLYYSKVFQKPSNHIWYQLSWEDNQTASTQGLTTIDVRHRTGDSLPYVSPITQSPYSLSGFNTLIQNSNPDSIDQLIYKWQISRSTLGASAAGAPSYSQGQTRQQVTTIADSNLLNNMGTATNTARLSRNNRVLTQYLITDSNPYVIILQPNIDINSIQVNGFVLSSTAAPLAGQYQVNQTSTATTISFNSANGGQYVWVKYILVNEQNWNYWSLPYLNTPAYIANNVSYDYIQFRIDLRSLDHVTPIEMYKFTISSLLTENADT